MSVSNELQPECAASRYATCASGACCPCGADVIARVETALGGKLDSPPDIHTVRDVAPGKLMLCVTFRVPEAVAFAGRHQQQQQQGADVLAAAAEGSPVAKKART